MSLPIDLLPANGLADRPGAASLQDSAAPKSTSDLIAFILNRYHQIHREELPGLIALARKVESAHASHPELPRGLASFLEELADDLEGHMQKEEQILFPLIIRGGHPMIGHPIGMMRAEHDAHATNLAALSALTAGLKLPQDACSSWQELYAGLAKFSDDLTQHIRTENEVLFPRASERNH